MQGDVHTCTQRLPGEGALAVGCQPQASLASEALQLRLFLKQKRHEETPKVECVGVCVCEREYE